MCKFSSVIWVIDITESDSSDSGSDSDSEKEEEMSEEWMEELKRKQAHPHRLHVDVWHNEQGQVSISIEEKTGPSS